MTCSSRRCFCAVSPTLSVNKTPRGITWPNERYELYNNPIASSMLGLTALAGGAAATTSHPSVLGVQLIRPAAAVHTVATHAFPLSPSAPGTMLQLVVAILTLVFAILAIAKIAPKRTRDRARAAR